MTINVNGRPERATYLSCVDGLIYKDIEVKKTTENAIQHSGPLFTEFTKHHTLSNDTAYKCSAYGLFNGLIIRKVSDVIFKVFN